MACGHDLLGDGIIQHAGLLALLDEHQILDVPLRAFDWAEIQPPHNEAVCGGIAHGVVQHLAVGGGVTDDTIFAHLFTACLELGLDQTDPIASGVVMACATGKM